VFLAFLDAALAYEKLLEKAARYDRGDMEENEMVDFEKKYFDQAEKEGEEEEKETVAKILDRVVVDFDRRTEEGKSEELLQLEKERNNLYVNRLELLRNNNSRSSAATESRILKTLLSEEKH
jgi:hypothetical protein